MTGASSELPSRSAIRNPNSRPHMVSVPRGRCGPWPSSDPPTTTTVSYPSRIASRTSVQVRRSSSSEGGWATLDRRPVTDANEPFDFSREALRNPPRQLAWDVLYVHHARVTHKAFRNFVLVGQRIARGVQQKCGTLELAQGRLRVVRESRFVHPVVARPCKQELHDCHVDQVDRAAFRPDPSVAVPRPPNVRAVRGDLQVGSEDVSPALRGFALACTAEYALEPSLPFGGLEQWDSGQNSVRDAFGPGAPGHFQPDVDAGMAARKHEPVQADVVDRLQQRRTVVLHRWRPTRRVGETMAWRVECKGPEGAPEQWQRRPIDRGR